MTIGLLLLALILGATGWAVWTARQVAQLLLHPPRATIDNGPDRYGLTDWETVNFTTEDNLTLTAWFIPPKPEAKGATLIFVHGWGGNRSSLLGQAALYHERSGYGALLLDTRNAGDSGGDTSTWGLMEAKDVQAAYHYLETRAEVSNGRVGLVGKSVGAATIIRAATKLPDVQVMVVQSSYTSFAHNLPAIIPQISGRQAELSPLVLRLCNTLSDLNMAEIRPIDDIATLTMPIIFAYGTDDTIVAITHGQALFDATTAPKQFYTAVGANHNNVFWQDEAAYAEAVIPFVDQYLLN